MNRFFRRMQRFGKSFGARQQASDARGNQESLYAAGTPQDVQSVRAKNEGHGKKTADKWNQ